jgi:hypothetical protein
VILLVAEKTEPVAALVMGRLREAGHEFRVLNPESEPERSWLHAEWRRGALHSGWFAGPDWRVDIGSLTGVFIRFGAPPDKATMQETDADRRAARIERVGLLCTVLDALPCTVINKLLGGMSNMSKPHQALIIRTCGLAVPETLVTNDPDAARAFVAAHRGAVIVKSLSGIRSIVRQIGPSHRARLPIAAARTGTIPGAGAGNEHTRARRRGPRFRNPDRKRSRGLPICAERGHSGRHGRDHAAKRRGRVLHTACAAA